MRPRLLAPLLLLLVPCAFPAAAATLRGDGTDTVAAALAAVSEDERIYNEHIVTLASPFMEGRVPGSRGMEIAKEYFEFWLKAAGVEPAFERVDALPDGSEARTPRASWRQPFELRGSAKLLEQHLAIEGLDRPLEAGVDYEALSLGASGYAAGPLVFVGYSILRGEDHFSSFPDGEVPDLAGKVAVMFRFEPMGENGWSRWRDGERWTARAGFRGKLTAAMRGNPAAILIVNPPGAADPRAKDLMAFSAAGDTDADVPVFLLTTEAGERLAAACDPEGRSLLDLRRLADEGGQVVELGSRATARTAIERKPLIAENVGGILPGRGKLAGEYVVIGGHLDHLGMGSFGSRADSSEQGKKLHPGADDNASGSAAILMLADKLKRRYDALPADADARSIVFVGFSAEESGLNGSRYYANNPIAPIESHALMINFDMIGRIQNGRLSVSGATTGEGLAELLAPHFAATPLEIVQPANLSGASDHTSFLRKEVPVLFGIIADFHDDYHTPRDVSALINRRGAVQTVQLFDEIAATVATHPERWEFRQPERRRRGERPTAAADAGDAGEPVTDRLREPNDGVAQLYPEFEGEGRPAPKGGQTPPAEQPGGGEGAGGESGESGGGPVGRDQIRVRFGIKPGYGAEEAGIPVDGVTAAGSAEKAGVQAGDRLTHWNGQAIDDVRHWMGMLAQHAPGDKVQVTLLRGGEEVVLWVTLQGTGSADE